MQLENYQAEFELEGKQLERVLDMARVQLEEALCQAKADKEELTAQRYRIREDASGVSPSSAGYMDMLDKLIELDGYAGAYAAKATLSELTTGRISVLRRMLEKPYFARIDFLFDDEDEPEPIYIGRGSLMNEQLCQIYVYDWRAPISSVFYRFGTGAADYDTPEGKVNGQTLLKRQYELYGGKLKFFFDAEVQIVDDILRKMLSGNAAQTMKSVVETIQREQDIIIRDMDNDLLMVQGIAGSGKTSVALHRAAYLMYKNLGPRLTYENIIVISPNKLFEQYIANVLPELGEHNVETFVMEEIFANVLGIDAKNIEPQASLLEKLLDSPNDALKSAIEFKLSPEFAEILQRFAEDVPRRFVEFTDVYYGGKCIASGAVMKSQVVNGRKTTPPARRLWELEQKIFDKVHAMHKGRLKALRKFVQTKPELETELEEYARLLSIYETTALAKGVRRFTELDVGKLYCLLIGDKNYLRKLAKGLSLPNNLDEILNLNDIGAAHSYADAAAMSYLSLALGCGDANEFRSIKQVVIDEAQDYYPLHYRFLGQIFSGARFTVLADVNQSIRRQESLELYSRLPKLLNKPKASLMTMNKSFRCTNEILKFSARFLGSDINFESFNRSGDEPRVMGFENDELLTPGILGEAQRYIDAGYGSVAILCRTRKACEELYERISKEGEAVKLAGGKQLNQLTGIFILPIYLAKGLEFDAAIIADADAGYKTEDDRRLLYVAATRALHGLSVFYAGEASPLLEEQGGCYGI